MVRKVFRYVKDLCELIYLGLASVALIAGASGGCAHTEQQHGPCAYLCSRSLDAFAMGAWDGVKRCTCYAPASANRPERQSQIDLETFECRDLTMGGMLAVTTMSETLPYTVTMPYAATVDAIPSTDVPNTAVTP